MDIQNTKEMLSFVVSVVNAVGKSYADGKVSLLDLVNFYDAVTKINGALDGIKDIASELKDLSAAERAELFDLIEGLDLPSDSKEVMVEKMLQAGLIIGEAILLAMPALKGE